MTESGPLAVEHIEKPKGMTWEQADAIMESCALPVDEDVYRGLQLQGKEFPESWVPFTEKELRDAKEQGMYLIWMPSLSLLDLSGKGYVKGWERYEAQTTVTTTHDAGYRLLGVSKVDKLKKYSDQVANLPEKYSVPNTVEMVYLWSVQRFFWNKRYTT